MSIQRWDVWGYEWEQDPHPEGDWVKYADHVAAVAELEGMTAEFYEKAYEAGRSSALREAVITHEDAAKRKGALAERARIKAAVQEIPKVAAFVDELAIVRLPHVLAIIDGDTGNRIGTGTEIVPGEHVDWCRTYNCEGCVEIIDGDTGNRIGQVSPQPSISDGPVQGYDGQWHRGLYGSDDA